MSGSQGDRPFLRLAVSALDSAEDQRLQTALTEIASQEHPGVVIDTHPKGSRYHLAGTAESALDLICDRLRDDYGIAINVAPPEAILIETIRKEAEAEGKYIRQTGGLGNYGHCTLRIAPAESGSGFEFINAASGSTVPSEFIKPIEEGVRAAMASGILAGLPLMDVRVTLLDGSYHENDSNDWAFNFAGSIAFKEAARKANPVILEPMMSFEMETVEAFALMIRSEIAAHRGRIERDEMSAASGMIKMKAIVPLSELLASASDELAAFQMKFAGYEPVRDDHSPGDGTADVTANKPNRPQLGSRSEMAKWDPEDD